MIKSLIVFILFATAMQLVSENLHSTEVIILDYSYLNYDDITVYNYDEERCEWVCW